MTIAFLLAVTLGRPLWSTTLGLGPSPSASAAFVTPNVIYAGTRNRLSALRVANGHSIWTRAGVGTPFAQSVAGIVASTAHGSAVLSLSGRIRYRRSWCEGSRPFFVAMNATRGVVLCPDAAAPRAPMKAIFFSLESGKVLAVRPTVLPSETSGEVTVPLSPGDFGVRGATSGGTMQWYTQVVSLVSLSVRNAAAGEAATIERAVQGMTLPGRAPLRAQCAYPPPFETGTGYLVTVCGFGVVYMKVYKAP